MKTRLPISTISYNTPAFLEVKLEELRRAHIISVWFYIKHKAEADEKRDHIHLWVLPAKQIQTDELVDELVEPVPGSDVPLKSLHFKSSKFPDWYMYCMHDAVYLSRKNQSRQYHYSKDDFVCSDRDELDAMVADIDMTAGSSTSIIVEARKQGKSFYDLVMQGVVPIPQFSSWLTAFEYLSGVSPVLRNDRVSHTPIDGLPSAIEIDPDTGEIVNSKNK